jgi:hypothetical protein
MLEEIAERLQKDVELKSKIDLYYRKDLGLHYIVTKGALPLLE